MAQIAKVFPELKGEKGEDGEKGENGQDGEDGENGQDGENGLSAYQIAVQEGFTGTKEQWITSLK